MKNKQTNNLTQEEARLYIVGVCPSRLMMTVLTSCKSLEGSVVLYMIVYTGKKASYLWKSVLDAKLWWKLYALLLNIRHIKHSPARQIKLNPSKSDKIACRAASQSESSSQVLHILRKLKEHCFLKFEKRYIHECLRTTLKSDDLSPSSITWTCCATELCFKTS